jgi:DNA topoisomerase-1
MADAAIKRSKLIANITDTRETIPDFVVNGSRVVFDGWLKVDVRARGEDTEVPKLKTGDPIQVKEIVIETKQTEPPNRYSEAGLIKELEKRGIGRPSTYASIMKTIVDRGYILKEGRTLIPTDTGDVVSSFLEKHFMEYISDTFTSEMEDELDEIAEGKRTYVKTLTDFYLPFQKDVAKKETIEKITNLGPGPKQFPCPLCGADMIIKLGRAGTFLSCSKFPDCNGARVIDGSELKPDAPIGVHPETNEPIFVMNGKFGPYVQIGETPEKVKGKKAVAPKRASLPAGVKPEDVTLENALMYLTLPRELGSHPTTGEPIIANTGKFGPYLAHAGDFRSLKGADNPYTITYERALEIYKEPKQMRKGEKLIKELGIHPTTRKIINLFESKSGRYLKKGFKRISIPDEITTEDMTIEVAVELLKQG